MTSLWVCHPAPRFQPTLFTIVDHVLEPYEDGKPQDENSAFLTGDPIVNSFNDNRQARLYLNWCIRPSPKNPSAPL